MAPRIVCFCHPVAAAISSRVAPSGGTQHFDQPRLLGARADLGLLRLGGDRHRVARGRVFVRGGVLRRGAGFQRIRGALRRHVGRGISVGRVGSLRLDPDSGQSVGGRDQRDRVVLVSWSQTRVPGSRPAGASAS